MSALVLVGCAGQSGDVADAADDDFSGVELTAWSRVPYEPYFSLNEGQLEACAAEIGASISVEAFPAGEFASRVLQAGSSGDLPNLLMVPTGSLPQFVDAGILTDLADYGLEPTDLADATAQLGVVDDTLYGIASHVETTALIFNPELVPTAPESFEELRAAAEAATTEGKYGIALPGTGDAASFFLLGFILSAGGDPSDFEDEGTIAAIQLYKDLVADGSMSSEMVNWTWDYQDQFSDGAAALSVAGPWTASPEWTNEPHEYALYPVSEGQTARSPITGHEGTIPVTDERAQAAAAAVLECRLSDANEVAVADAQYYLPARQVAAAEFVEENEALAPFFETIPDAFDQSGTFGDEWPHLSAQLVSAIQYAVVGGMSAEEALQTASKE